MDDHDAISRCRMGEVDAYRHLVERYQTEAMGHALAIVGHREDAADAVQAAFVQAFQALARFEMGRRFYPWFYVILRNCCLKMMSKRRLLAVAEEQGLELLAAPESDLVEEERTRLLEQALRQLEPRDRELIMLKHLDRLTYEELSERMGIPPGTVMSRLYHARKRLLGHVEHLRNKEL